MKRTEFALGEIFCGPGGLALGAASAAVSKNGHEWGIRPIWASDADYDSCVTYAHNIHKGDGSAVFHGSIEKLKFKKLPKIDAFAFGFPCNDYSAVGERNGVNGKYGSLYRYGVKALNYFKPKWFIAENVYGLSFDKHSDVFSKIIKELKSAGNGYNLTTHLYKFEDYGVPQRRHRIIIVGIKKSLGLTFRVPAPTTANRWPTAEKALSDLHSLVPNNEPASISEEVINRLIHTPAGHNAWSKQIPSKYQLKGVKGAKLSNIYKRLRRDAPAYTVTGTGGGGTHMYHWEAPRPLTNRERARLQTFPDDFVFLGGKDSVRRQVGMAVPPRGAQVIFEAILKTFSGIGYRSIDPKWDSQEMG